MHTYDEVEALLLSQILSSFSKLSSSPQVEVDVESTKTIGHYRLRYPIPFIAVSEHKEVLGGSTGLIHSLVLLVLVELPPSAAADSHGP